MQKLKALIATVFTALLFSCTMAPAMAQSMDKQKACVELASTTDTMRLGLSTGAISPKEFRSDIKRAGFSTNMQKILLDNLDYAIKNVDMPKNLFMTNVYSNCIRLGSL